MTVDARADARPVSSPASSVDDLPFLFDAGHHAVADAARRVVAEIVAVEDAAEAGEAAVGRATIAALGGASLLACFAGAATVGSGDLRALCLVREALAWASGAADSLFAVQGLGSYPIHAFGDDDQRARYLPDALAGRSVAAFALTEPEAGSDVASLRTLAVRGTRVPGERDDMWRLDGSKTFISNAPIADHFVVFANAAPERGRKGITAFIVPRSAPGLTVDGPLPMLADHSIGSLHFADCFVEDADRLGEVGDGFRIAMSTLDRFRVTVGAAAVGMARRALDEALYRAVRRRQFDKEIGEFQQIQAYLADSRAELDAARLLVYRAARLKDDGAASITEEAAIAKMYATEAAQRIIDRAVQIHGGLGVVRGVPVERLYREIRALRIYEGTTEIQRVVIAGKMLARERARG